MSDIELRDDVYTKEELIGIRRYIANWLDDSKADLSASSAVRIPAYKVISALENRVKELDERIHGNS